MGGYAASVWPSFIVCAVLMVGLVVASRHRQRRTAGRLAEVERLVRGAKEDEGA